MTIRTDPTMPVTFAVQLHNTDADEAARAVYIGAGASIVIVPAEQDDDSLLIDVDVTDLLPQTAADLLRLAADALERTADEQILGSLAGPGAGS